PLRRILLPYTTLFRSRGYKDAPPNEATQNGALASGEMARYMRLLPRWNRKVMLLDPVDPASRGNVHLVHCLDCQSSPTKSISVVGDIHHPKAVTKPVSGLYLNDQIEDLGLAFGKPVDPQILVYR